MKTTLSLARHGSTQLFRKAVSSGLALATLAGSATAQSPAPVTTVRIDDGSVVLREEMVLRASRFGLDIIAAWQERQNINFFAVVYNTSTNGKDFHDAGFL